jgi:MoaA/NifB/PqqE/SkfB family radical SAM enzyme
MIDARPLLNLISDRLHALPMVVLYITDGCNSRCITCDIWKLPRRNMSIALAEQLAGEFAALGGRAVVLSGGEAMQHPEWPRIAELFRARGARVNLLTNGLALKKQAAQVIEHIDSVTVSLDGGTPETYRTIRGVDAYDVVLDGIRAVSEGGIPVTTRTTVQRRNFREMSLIVDAAKDAGVRKISFLAVDVSNMEAFGPRFDAAAAHQSLPLLPESPALTPDDLPEFAAVLDRLAVTHADDFTTGRIAESVTKLRRLHRYFEAVNGLTPFDGPRCNAPHISTVIEVDGAIRPCFFLPAMGKFDPAAGGSLPDALNSPEALDLRRAYRSGERHECERCVCPLYRGPRALMRGI